MKQIYLRSILAVIDVFCLLPLSFRFGVYLLLAEVSTILRKENFFKM